MLSGQILDAMITSCENAKTVLVHGNGGTIAIHCTLILGNEAAA